MMRSSALVGALVLSWQTVVSGAPTASELVCGPYIPYGPNYRVPNGNVNFKGSNIDAYGYPGKPMTTAGDYYSAYTFNVQTCNSTSLGLHSSVTPKGCDASKSNCHSVNYIQITDPSTGLCMTWAKYGATSNVTFAPCNNKPTSSKQLFKAQSMTNYIEFNNPGPLSPVFVGTNNHYSGNWSFYIAPDGKNVTIGNSTASGTLVNGTYIATTRK